MINKNFSDKQVLAKLAPSPPCSPLSLFLHVLFKENQHIYILRQ